MPIKTKETLSYNKKPEKNKYSTKKVTKTTLKKLIKNETIANRKAISERLKNKKAPEVVEYYDLPYRYNETIVKILYQTPDTLFVYWDISDKDRENYIQQYGENFFNVTRPVLIIHNDSMNYSFEIPINDFANSWYLHVNDSKCNYRVELGRRPNYYAPAEESIKTDYIYVSDSNKIESPNDHVLYSTNENNTVKFKNIKNNEEKSVQLYDIIKRLPRMKRSKDIPYISEEILKNLYGGIYENKDLSLFERISNPSSGGNPTSGSMPSSF